MFTFPEHTDLEVLVNTMRPLMLNRYVSALVAERISADLARRMLHNIPGLRLGVYDAATYMTREEAFPGGKGKPLTPEIEREIIAKAGGAAWVSSSRSPLC